MLFPSIIRHGDDLVLKEPNKLTQFIHVSDLVDYLYLVPCGAKKPYYGAMIDPFIQTGAYKHVPGTFALTPKQLKLIAGTLFSMHYD